MGTATKTIAPELIGTWGIDPNHSTVEAVARYAMLTQVRGRFASFTGTITVGETLEDSRVEVEIDASSITTQNETRDGHLKSEDFLHVEQHPTIRFHTTRVEEIDQDTFKVWGELTMRGVTNEVELDMTFEGVCADPWGNTRAGIVATTTINRKDWGVNWNAMLEAGGVLVSDKLKIELNISAIKRQGLGPVWKAIADAHASATRKMPTPVLTRLLQEAVLHQTPKRAGAFRPKLRYAHQGGMKPPVIVIHGNSLEHVTDVYKRFLEGRFRAHFKLVGTPLRIEMRSSSNPFADKE